MALAVLPAAFSTTQAGSSQPDNNQNREVVAAKDWDKFLTEVADAKMSVNAGQTKAARRAFETIKKQFPEIAKCCAKIVIEKNLGNKIPNAPVLNKPKTARGAVFGLTKGNKQVKV